MIVTHTREIQHRYQILLITFKIAMLEKLPFSKKKWVSMLNFKGVVASISEKGFFYSFHV